MPSARSHASGKVITVRVCPRSQKPRVVEDAGGCYKVYVSAAPEKGKANKQVVKILARHLGLRKTSLEIIRGQSSREKLIKIHE